MIKKRTLSQGKGSLVFSAGLTSIILMTGLLLAGCNGKSGPDNLSDDKFSLGKRPKEKEEVIAQQKNGNKEDIENKENTDSEDMDKEGEAHSLFAHQIESLPEEGLYYPAGIEILSADVRGLVSVKKYYSSNLDLKEGFLSGFFNDGEDMELKRFSYQPGEKDFFSFDYSYAVSESNGFYSSQYIDFREDSIVLYLDLSTGAKFNIVYKRGEGVTADPRQIFVTDEPVIGINNQFDEKPLYIYSEPSEEADIVGEVEPFSVSEFLSEHPEIDPEQEASGGRITKETAGEAIPEKYFDFFTIHQIAPFDPELDIDLDWYLIEYGEKRGWVLCTPKVIVSDYNQFVFENFFSAYLINE